MDGLAVIDAPLLGPVYPELVRARIVAGWMPDRAATAPAARKARLSPAAAAQARASKASAQELANELGISVRHARRIRSGRAWKRTDVAVAERIISSPAVQLALRVLAGEVALPAGSVFLVRAERALRRVPGRARPDTPRCPDAVRTP